MLIAERNKIDVARSNFKRFEQYSRYKRCANVNHKVVIATDWNSQETPMKQIDSHAVVV